MSAFENTYTIDIACKLKASMIYFSVLEKQNTVDITSD